MLFCHLDEMPVPKKKKKKKIKQEENAEAAEVPEGEITGEPPLQHKSLIKGAEKHVA